MWGSGKNKPPAKTKLSNQIQQLIPPAGTAVLFIGLALLVCGMLSRSWTVTSALFKKGKATLHYDHMEHEFIGIIAKETFTYHAYATPWKTCEEKIKGIDDNWKNPITKKVKHQAIVEKTGICKYIYVTDGCNNAGNDDIESCHGLRAVIVFSYLGTLMGIAALLSSLITLVLSMIGRTKMAPALFSALAGIGGFLSVLIAVSIYASYHGDFEKRIQRLLDAAGISMTLGWGFALTILGGVMMAGGGLVVAAGAVLGAKGLQKQEAQNQEAQEQETQSPEEQRHTGRAVGRRSTEIY